MEENCEIIRMAIYDESFSHYEMPFSLESMDNAKIAQKSLELMDYLVSLIQRVLLDICLGEEEKIRLVGRMQQIQLYRQQLTKNGNIAGSVLCYLMSTDEAMEVYRKELKEEDLFV